MRCSKMKFLAVFLSLTMIISLIPAAVFADGPDNEPKDTETTVAEVRSKLSD